MRFGQITLVPYLGSKQLGNPPLGQVCAEPTTFQPIRVRPQEVIFSVVGLAEYPRLLGQPCIIGCDCELDSSWHHVPVFDSILCYVALQFIDLSFPVGDTFKDNDDDYRLYIIKSGMVKSAKSAVETSGLEAALAILKPWNSFGESASSTVYPTRPTWRQWFPVHGTSCLGAPSCRCFGRIWR